MPGAELRVLYRGDLASCNYSCHYCPFAKRNDSTDVTARDRDSLLRFVDWCETTHFGLRILFTPWGEALVRKHYRDAFLRLSHASNVIELGIQTNLSRDPAWLASANNDAVNLWCTYHPSQESRSRFLRRLEQLRQLRIRFSVGMVALREDLDEIRAMHLALGQLDQRAGVVVDPAQQHALVEQRDPGATQAIGDDGMHGVHDADAHGQVRMPYIRCPTVK